MGEAGPHGWTQLRTLSKCEAWHFSRIGSESSADLRPLTSLENLQALRLGVSRGPSGVSGDRRTIILVILWSLTTTSCGGDDVSATASKRDRVKRLGEKE